MDKRNVMNLLLAGGIALPVGALAVPYALFFVPVRYISLRGLILTPTVSNFHCTLLSRSAGGGAGGIAAKDALGNDITETSWLATHKPGDHSLAQGLKVC